jgi:hypothetical protein
MKSLFLSLLALSAATASHGALAELNVASGSIESPDGTFVGRDFTIVDGFKLELLYLPPASQGQWVALDWDSKGRLIVPSYSTDVMARLTIPKVGSNEPVKAEMIDTTKVGAAEGVLNAFSSLYMNVNRSGTMRAGLYRLTDTNNDDKWDTTRVLRVRQGDGSDHGTHTLRLTPDGKMISVISGNATRLTEHNRSRVPEIWGEDNLVQRLVTPHVGFNRAPEGHIVNMSPDGSDIELWSIGMRNPVSQAYNKDGEMFVYDADEEPSMGYSPAYRPTDILHVISGADAGWRASSRVHPFYYFDNFGPIAAVGSGSPVGGIFGTGAKFPVRYQDSYFIADWSFGNLWAVQTAPDGSSYKATPAPFISGRPFAVSGAIVNPADGSLIVQTTGTQLYRVTYVGVESTAPSQPDKLFAAFRDQRHKLEAFHGRKDAAAVNTAWPFLGDQDRATRYAARLAIEWQDPASWSERALNETDPRRTMAAIAALARVSGRDQYHTPTGTAPNRDKALQNRMLEALNRIDWKVLTYQEKIDLMRAYQLTMIRLGMPEPAMAQRIIAKLDPHLPVNQRELDWELSEVLIYLQAPSAATKVMALLRTAPGAQYFGIQEWINPQQRQRQDRGDVTGANIGISQATIAKQEDQQHYAEMLRTLKTGWTPELRREYLEWFNTGPRDFAGNFTGQLSIVKADAVSQLSTEEKSSLQAVIDLPVAGGRGRGGAGAGGGGGRGGAAVGTPGLGAPAASFYILPGGDSLRAFNDVDLTIMSRFDEGVEKQIKAQADANAALLTATFTAGTTPAVLQARVAAVAEAEQALALARAGSYGKLRDDLKITPEKVPALITAMNNRSARGGRGGGGGGGGSGAAPGAAGPAAAPAARGGQ